MGRRAVLLFVALVATLGLLWPVPAQAHASLVSSDPEPGTVLAQAPEQLELTFSDGVEPPSSWELLLPDGTTRAVPTSVHGDAVRVRFGALTAQGTHVLAWQALSPDGHTIRGSLPFAVGHESALVVPTPVPDAGQLPVLGALLLTLGAVVGCGLAWSRRVLGDRVRTAIGARTWWIGWSVCVVLAATGTGLRLTELRADVGHLPAPDLAAAGLLGAGLLGLLPGISRRADRGSVAAGVTTGLAGLAVLVSLALTGHTRGAENPWLTGFADVVHAGAGAAWVGGLLVLALAWRRLAPEQRSAVTARFVTLAAVALAVVTATGIALAVALVESAASLTRTDHGRWLLAKVAVVLLAVVLGGWHRWRVRDARRGPAEGGVAEGDAAKGARAEGDRAEGDRAEGGPAEGGAGPRLSTLRFEAVLLVAVVAVAGVLTEMSPRPDPNPGRVVERVMAHGDLQVRVRVAPALVGVNQVEVQVRDGAGSWVPTAAATEVRFVRDERALGGPLRAAGEVELLTTALPESGEWRLEVALQLSRLDAPVFSVPVRIDPST